MKPVCRPGDLAVIIKANRTPGLNGRFVVVIRAHKHGERYPDGSIALKDTPGKIWWIKSAVSGAKIPQIRNDGALRHYDEVHIADKHLFPIRDNDGTDETLRETLPLKDKA